MKFSFRDLLSFTVFMALVVAVGWGLDRYRRNMIIEGKNVLEEVKRLNREKDRRMQQRNNLPDSSAPAPNPPKK